MTTPPQKDLATGNEKILQSQKCGDQIATFNKFCYHNNVISICYERIEQYLEIVRVLIPQIQILTEEERRLDRQYMLYVDIGTQQYLINVDQEHSISIIIIMNKGACPLCKLAK